MPELMCREATCAINQGIVCLCIRGTWEYKWRELKAGNRKIQETVSRRSRQADNLSFQAFNFKLKVVEIRLVSNAE